MYVSYVLPQSSGSLSFSPDQEFGLWISRNFIYHFCPDMRFPKIPLDRNFGWILRCFELRMGFRIKISGWLRWLNWLHTVPAPLLLWSFPLVFRTRCSDHWPAEKIMRDCRIGEIHTMAYYYGLFYFMRLIWIFHGKVCGMFRSSSLLDKNHVTTHLLVSSSDGLYPHITRFVWLKVRIRYVVC